MTAVGAASVSMNSIRASGSAGSIGRYAAPVLSTASIATIASAERSNSSATHCPGPTPRPANRCANRLAASSSSRYVSERPSKLIATASGARATCVGEQHRNRHRRGRRLGQHRPVADLIEAGVLTGIEHIDRRQPRASGRRSWPPTPAAAARSVPRCWRRRTRRCEIPPSRRSRRAHRPRLQRSARENDRSMRAVWVSTGIWVTCRPPNASPAAGSSVVPGEVLPGQHHLHQRVMGQGSGGVEPLDQHLKGHVLVLVGGQAAPSHLGQQLGDTGIPGQIDPQHQGVDEKPHQLIQRGVAAPGDREPHRHIRTGAQLRQQHRQGGLDHHEAGRVVLTGHPRTCCCSSAGQSTATVAPR